MTARSLTSDYALGSTDAEHERLMRQAARLAPLTERFFRDAGIGPGQRVLDLGSGIGDVAMLAVGAFIFWTSSGRKLSTKGTCKNFNHEFFADVAADTLSRMPISAEVHSVSHARGRQSTRCKIGISEKLAVQPLKVGF